MFTDLLSAQSWQQSEGNVTSIRVSLKGVEEVRSAVEPIMDELVQALNQSIGVDESGLQMIAESDAVTIASTNGLGRLSPRIVHSLAENRSALTTQAGMMEVLQVPLVQLESQSSNLLTLADGDLSGLVLENEALWHWGAAGYGFEANNTAWAWRVPDGEIISDVSIHNGFGFAAYGQGLVVGNVSNDDETEYLLEDRNIVAVSSNSSQWYALEDDDSATLWSGTWAMEVKNRFHWRLICHQQFSPGI